MIETSLMPPRIPSPPFLPDAIANFGRECPKCRRFVRPDIWEWHKEAFGPVFPKGTHGEKGAWIQTTVSKACECGEIVHVGLSPKTLAHPVFFYGDESERIAGRWSVECYSLIGGTTGPVADMEAGLTEAKRRLLPEINPKSWRVHCRELNNGRERANSPLFKDLSPSQVQQFFSACASILKRSEQYTWNHAIFGFRQILADQKQEGASKKAARELTHLALLSFAIYKATKQELRPQFILDATKEVKALPHIESWSRDSYLGSRHFLAHEILSHGNDITPPELVPPGSRPLLELADVHAFHFARSLQARALGKKTNIPMTYFGKFCYIAVINSNRVEFIVTDDIPKKYVGTG